MKAIRTTVLVSDEALSEHTPVNHEVERPPSATEAQSGMLAVIENVGIPKYDDCSNRGASIYSISVTTNRGHRTDA